MKGIDKKIFIFVLVVMMLLTSGFTKNAYADWEKYENNWRYIGDFGYAKGWQEINEKWYYFSTDTGIMKIGWFYDEKYSKWYYLNNYGDMDSSKTTSDYPTELSDIQNRIKQYVNVDVIYESTNQIDNTVYVRFMSNDETASTQYYYQPSTGNIYEVKNGILTNLSTNEKIDSFTEEQAVQVVYDYLSDNYEYIPKNIKVEVDDGDSYFIHCYDTEGDPANSSWYHVNKTTREVTLS
ncbi:cell wall-binding protein [Clostridium sp.]|uniref:cell wall-binding protein n=1 Tax=Clostridium sp. TaxID=1506 RepID=UPI00284B4FB1|nr:cell wall-binding protein [Clostridium sp.]MDR3596426.1 cell wall-binding protein [Clostridium sp.]